ncbi:MAG: YbaK/EbsC family protein [Alistipes sp.]
MAHGKIEKTNAARLLDRAKIAYELVPYRVDEEHLAATHAEELGEDMGSVFKTLVLRGDRPGHFVCVVPADHEVDQGRRMSGQQEGRPDSDEELLPVTGYIRGGCSPIGMKKQFPTYSPPRPRRWPSTSAPASAASTENRPGGAHSFRRGDRGGNQPGRVVPE